VISFIFTNAHVYLAAVPNLHFNRLEASFNIRTVFVPLHVAAIYGK
jgi:hypothetical protein